MWLAILDGEANVNRLITAFPATSVPGHGLNVHLFTASTTAVFKRGLVRGLTLILKTSPSSLISILILTTPEMLARTASSVYVAELVQ